MAQSSGPLISDIDPRLRIPYLVLNDILLPSNATVHHAHCAAGCIKACIKAYKMCSDGAWQPSTLITTPARDWPGSPLSRKAVVEIQRDSAATCPP